MTHRFEARTWTGVSSSAAVWLPCAVGLSICLLVLVGGPSRSVLRPIGYAAAASLLAGPAALAWKLCRRYELTRFDLVIRSGPFRRTIRLECIEGATGSPPRRASGPAAGRGLARVSVLYGDERGRRSVVLYPEDPDFFLDSLARRSPFLERRGGGLVRRGGLLAIP